MTNNKLKEKFYKIHKLKENIAIVFREEEDTNWQKTKLKKLGFEIKFITDSGSLMYKNENENLDLEISKDHNEYILVDNNTTNVHRFDIYYNTASKKSRREIHNKYKKPKKLGKKRTILKAKAEAIREETSNLKADIIKKRKKLAEDHEKRIKKLKKHQKQMNLSSDANWFTEKYGLKSRE